MKDRRKIGVPRNAYSNFVSACRSATWPTISDGMVLHHTIFSFREIVDDFVQTNKIDPRDILFLVRGRFVWFADSDLAKRFTDYHKSRAITVKLTPEQHGRMRNRPKCQKWVSLDKPVRLNNKVRENSTTRGRRQDGTH
jgi:hypothetical protein